MKRTFDVGGFPNLSSALTPTTSSTPTTSTTQQPTPSPPGLLDAAPELSANLGSTALAQSQGGLTGAVQHGYNSLKGALGIGNGTSAAGSKGAAFAASPHAMAAIMPGLYFAGVGMMKQSQKDNWGIETGDTLGKDYGVFNDDSGRTSEYSTRFKKTWTPKNGWEEHAAPGGMKGREAQPHGTKMQMPDRYGRDDFKTKTVENHGYTGYKSPFGVLRGQGTVVRAALEMDAALAEMMTEEQIQKVADKLDQTRMLSASFKGVDQEAAQAAAIELLTQRRDTILEAAGIELPSAPGDTSDTGSGVSGLFDIGIKRT